VVGEPGRDTVTVVTEPSGAAAPPTSGDGGDDAGVFEYTAPVPATVHVVTHDLGRDPVSIQVWDDDGLLCDGYSVVFTVPGQQVRIGFDVSIKATIRLH